MIWTQTCKIPNHSNVICTSSHSGHQCALHTPNTQQQAHVTCEWQGNYHLNFVQNASTQNLRQVQIETCKFCTQCMKDTVLRHQMHGDTYAPPYKQNLCNWHFLWIFCWQVTHALEGHELIESSPSTLRLQGEVSFEIELIDTFLIIFIN